MGALLFSEKAALIGVTLIGMAFCSAGVGQVAARGAWLHPFAFIGYALGALILVIVGAALLGIRLPLVDSTRAALIAVVVLALAKVVLTQLHRVIA
ncbi:MAG TPA: hypothetical protein VNK95_00770 [Caldilineaceae bacterium]|nr:hypothetical protein [Caldilineaceae bacterium]